MTNESLQIVLHSLGLDEYGRGRRYRNHFVTSPGGQDWALCMEHVEAGRMTKHGPSELFGDAEDGYCFCVTDAGIQWMEANRPDPPKLTRGQKRYREFLAADSSFTFGEWLKMQKTV